MSSTDQPITTLLREASGDPKQLADSRNMRRLRIVYPALDRLPSRRRSRGDRGRTGTPRLRTARPSETGSFRGNEAAQRTFKRRVGRARPRDETHRLAGRGRGASARASSAGVSTSLCSDRARKAAAEASEGLNEYISRTNRCESQRTMVNRGKS
jgi:hypothetical protein